MQSDPQTEWTEPTHGHYYEITAEGRITQRSAVGRYRGAMRLRGVRVWWFTGDAFELMVDPDYITNLEHLGRFYGRTL